MSRRRSHATGPDRTGATAEASVTGIARRGARLRQARNDRGAQLGGGEIGGIRGGADEVATGSQLAAQLEDDGPQPATQAVAGDGRAHGAADGVADLGGG